MLESLTSFAGGNTLASGGLGGVAIVWNVPKSAVYHMAVKRPINAILREWRRTVGSEITQICVNGGE